MAANLFVGEHLAISGIQQASFNHVGERELPQNLLLEQTSA
jgi:hypothetical protein